MSYVIEQVELTRESAGDYKYRIYKSGNFIATYWHDCRGDEHGIEFSDGRKKGWPVGQMIDFIEGGGPKPLVLSSRAVAYLNENTK